MAGFGRWAGRGFVIILAAGLGWLAVGQGLAHILAEARPELALMLRPGQAEALDHRSQALLADSFTPQAVSEARSAAERNLTAAPISPVGLRDLATLAEVGGNREQAIQLMTLADVRSRRVSAVQQWLFYRQLNSGDYQKAFAALDPLLRRRAVTPAAVAPVIRPLLAEPEALDALSEYLIAAPPWRSEMLRVLTVRPPQIEPINDLFEKLAASNAPPTQAERRLFAAMQAIRGDFAAAALTAGATRGQVTDGSFEGSPVAEPFSWRLNQGGAIFAERVPAPGGGQALRAEWGARDTVILAEQMVWVTPGRYRLSGQAQVEAIKRGGWVSWVASCAGTSTPIVEARESSVTSWRSFAQTFTIPMGCAAINLRLQTVGGDGVGLSTAWYDNIVLTPLAN